MAPKRASAKRKASAMGDEAEDLVTLPPASDNDKETDEDAWETEDSSDGDLDLISGSESSSDSEDNPGDYVVNFAMKTMRKAGKQGEHPADKVELVTPEYPNALTEYICMGHGSKEEDPKKQSKKVQGKPTSQFPDWKWKMTRSAMALSSKWDLEDQKRDQDSIGCYFFNDFSGYGQCENLENMVQAAYKEFTMKPFDIERYWTHVQAMGLHFHGNDLVPLNMIDDSDRVANLIALIGQVILSALNKLDRNKLLQPDSKIENIALICSLYLEFARGESDLFDDAVGDWAAKIIAYCKHFNIELSDKTGVVGTHKAVELFEDESISYTGGTKSGFKKAGEDRWGFTAAYNKYYNRYREIFTPFKGEGPGGLDKSKRIGGIEYDITKMTKKQRMKAAFDGKDPLDEMGMPPE